MNTRQHEFIRTLQKQLELEDDEINELCDELGLFDKEANWEELEVTPASDLIDHLLTLKHRRQFP